MLRIALHDSCFVGSRFGYQTPGSWEECVGALNDYFEPADTFEQRFDDLLARVWQLGFKRMDVWQPAELNWQWATARHIEAARKVISRRGMEITSLAGEFGVTREEFEFACRLASAIGAPLLSGTTALLSTDREYVVGQLEKYNLRLAIENEVEFTPQEILQQIGDGDRGRIGTAVDTGWWATHNYDVVKAIHELREFILHVHLKDVLPGEEHINCGYGKGCVPIADCVHALSEIGYIGVVSIENHSLDHDPLGEIVEARCMLENRVNELG